MKTANTEKQKCATRKTRLAIPVGKLPDNILLMRARKRPAPDNIAELLYEVERRGLELELHNALSRANRFIVIKGGA